MSEQAPQPDAVGRRPIDPDEDIWRRIIRQWVVPDDEFGGKRLSSAAFEPSKDGTPASGLVAAEVTPAVLLAGRDDCSVAAITPRDAQAHHHVIERHVDPAQGDHAAHVYIRCTMTGTKGALKQLRLELGRKARYVTGPVTWGGAAPRDLPFE